MQPTFNFDVSAPLSVLAFLGTAALLLAAGGTGLFLLARGNRYAARRTLLAVMGLGGIYAAALVGFSAGSRERLLEPGGRKYFCELDCHLAYSVLGTAREPAGRGVRQTVDLRVWFDPSTTSARRGDGLLYPNPRRIALVDRDGRRYAPADQTPTLVSSGAETWAPLTHPLRPGESYRTRLVFDLPRDARPDRLVLVESDPVTRLLIGHENSLLHAQTAFALPAGGGGPAR